MLRSKTADIIYGNTLVFMVNYHMSLAFYLSKGLSGIITPFIGEIMLDYTHSPGQLLKSSDCVRFTLTTFSIFCSSCW